MVNRSSRPNTAVEYDPKEASPSKNVCSNGVITHAIRRPYHQFGSVGARVWPIVLVSVSQHPTIRMLSLYLYIPPRDGLTQQDPEDSDPRRREGFSLCGSTISPQLTFSLNVSSLLRNTSCFEHNIQFGFSHSSGKKKKLTRTK